jgi:hypothetical protein
LDDAKRRLISSKTTDYFGEVANDDRSGVGKSSKRSSVILMNVLQGEIEHSMLNTRQAKSAAEDLQDVLRLRIG